MEAIAANTRIMPLLRNGVSGSCLWNPLVKGGLKECNEARIGKNLAELADALSVRRVMRWGYLTEALKRSDDRIISINTTAQIFAEHGFKTNGINVVD